MKRKESLIILLFSVSFAAPIVKDTGSLPGTTLVGTEHTTHLDFTTSQQVVDEALYFSRILHTYYPGYGNPARFNGYGQGEGQFVCTTFASEVFWRAGWPISLATWQKIQINTLERGVNLSQLLQNEDPRMKGIVHALTSSGLGLEIAELDRLQPGDWIQYWYGSTSGAIKGHVVMVLGTEMTEDGLHLRVLGANESTHGVAEQRLHLLDETGKKRVVRAYAVRPLLTKAKAGTAFHFTSLDLLDPAIPSWINQPSHTGAGLGAFLAAKF